MPIADIAHYKSAALFCCAFLLFASCTTILSLPFRENNAVYYFEPDVRVMINTPEYMDKTKPSVLILYALPNGNTIEMTSGRKMTPGLDWHYDIQHIAAQIRFIRSTLSDRNILIAYLETQQKSWPLWRQQHPNNASNIARIVDYIRFETNYPEKIILAGHSGGGSFITGYVNANDSIPGFISRIIYLDANYSFDDSLSHGRKLFHWLTADTSTVLCVIAYDDREITLNGKKVVGPTGGTYRATHRMIQSMAERTDVATHRDSIFKYYDAMNQRARFIIHTNPDTTILHTILVERNGLIHSLLLKTPYEEKGYTFFGARAYSTMISEE